LADGEYAPFRYYLGSFYNKPAASLLKGDGQSGNPNLPGKPQQI
jgi:hypothetical protein